MRVLLYTGGRNAVRQSGVGTALSHQERALAMADVDFTENPREEYDLVHINTVLPDARWMAAKARREGKKVVWHGHSTMEDFRRSFVGSNPAAPLFKKWLKSCYGSADLVLTPTEYSRKLLEGYGMGVEVVPISNGVDTGYFRKEPGQRRRFRERWGFEETQKVILCVGLPIERKGILDVIDLAGRLPWYQFVWCGHTYAGLLPGKIRRAIARAPGNLHFPGYLNREELRDAYGGCDLFFFPTYEETEGIVMLEALSMKIPVLVRDIPAYGDWLEHGAHVWKERDIPGFEARIQAILDQTCPDLTERGFQAARERDLRIVGESLASLYRAVIR